MKRTYKIISIICVCILSFNILTVIGSAKGTGTEADPYIITTAEELQNINNNVSAHYKLGTNIDLADMEFTPIGNVDTGSFTGSFDGNGYTIYNLDVYSGKYAGLFGSNEGIIKNVILENIYVYGTRYIGGVVAYNTALGTVENCKVLSGLVETDGGINNIQIGGVCGRNEGAFNGAFSNGADVDASATDVTIYAGGICGYWNSSLTEELNIVSNTGKISSISTVTSSNPYAYSGGLVGYAYSTITIIGGYNTGNITSYAQTCYSGGLAGYTRSTTTINNSYNTGNISSYDYFGGLIGCAKNTTTISNSYNTGDVSFLNSSDACSGGLVGYVGSKITINNSYNTGNISSYEDSGGLVGYAHSNVTINESYNTGNVSSSSSNSGGLVGCAYDSSVAISNSYNTGEISSSYYHSSYSLHSGGFVGYVRSSSYAIAITISNSYNTGNIFSSVSSSSYSGGFVGGTYGTSKKIVITISFSYSTGEISSSSYSGAIVGDVDTGNTTIDCDSSFIINGSVVKGYTLYGEPGICLSSVEMKKQSSYVDWDFDEVWAMDSNINSGYPILKTTASPLSLNISNKIMLAGSTLQLKAYKNSVVTDDVNWSVTSGAATVSSIGLVTAGSGLATVTATDSEGNKANFNTYIITKATSLTATDRTINLSQSGIANSSYFTVNGSDTDFVASYQSSDTSVITVDGVGYLTPVKVGTATITATTAGGVSATQTVTVEGSAKSISIPTTLTVSVGSTQKITATTSPNPTTSDITWGSSDTSVATVDSEGNVTGLKSGTTIITATTDNGYSSTCTVTVNAPITEMAFETPSLTLYTNETFKLKLNITPTNTTDTITYSTSSSTYASVTSVGMVTAKKAGTVTITATSSSGQKAYCNITIKSWPSVLTAVDSTTTISNRYIMTDADLTTKIKDLVVAKTGYSITATPSHSAGGKSYFGTGSTVDVYDEYGNLVITYTVVVSGDLNGDSVVDVLDSSQMALASSGKKTLEGAYALAGDSNSDDIIDISDYQDIVNKAVS